MRYAALNLILDKLGHTKIFYRSMPGWLYALVIALLYLVVARASLWFISQPENISTFWPPSGLLVAILVLNSPEQNRKILIAVFVANATTNLLGGNNLVTSIGFAIANCVEAILANWILRRYIDTPIDFTRVRDVTCLMLGVVVISNAITALLGAAVATLGTGAPFFTTWQVWWFADGIGMILFTPFFWTWSRGIDLGQIKLSRLIEQGVLVLVSGVLAHSIFSAPVTGEIQLSPYLLFPFLIWASLRLGMRTVTMALVCLSVIAELNTDLGLGPFYTGITFQNTEIVEVQLFLLILGSTMLLLTSAQAERERAKQHDQLDQRRLTSLLKISQQKTDSLHQLLNLALDHAIGLSDSKIGYIYYYREATQEFILSAWSSAVRESCSIPNPPTVYQLSKTGIWGEAVRQRRPIILNNFQAPHPLKKGYPQGHAPLFRYMTLPVFSDGQIVAVVGVANKAHEYTQLDVDQLTLMMDSIWKIAERKHTENELQASEMRYRSLFEDAAVAILEQDLSEIKLYLEVLGKQGIDSLDNYFAQHPDQIVYCAGLAKIIEVNQKGVALFQSNHKEQILFHLFDYFTGESWNTFGQMLSALAQGKSLFESELAIQRPSGDIRYLLLSASVAPLYQTTLARVLISLTDVTERRQAEHALIESQERYHRLVEYSPDAIYVHANGKLVYANAIGARLLGVENAQELVGAPIADFVHPDYREQFCQTIDVTTPSNSLPLLESKFIRRDGSFVEIEAAAISFQFANQPAVQTIVRDISERKRAERALKSSEELFRQLAENVREVFWVRDVKTRRIIYINPVYEQIFGRTRMSLYEYPDSFQTSVHPQDKERIVQATTQQKNGGLFNEQYRIVRPDGMVRWIWARTYPIVDEQGQIYRMVGIAEDITESKQAETDLREREEWLRESQRIAHIGSYRFDIRQGMWQSTATLDELFGIDEKYIKSVDGWLHLIHPAERNLMANYLQNHVILAREKFDQEYRIIRPIDQQERWVHGRGALTFDEYDNPVTLFGTIQDITERKQREREMQAIASISAALRSASTRTEMLNIIATQIIELLNAETITIGRYDPITHDGIHELAVGGLEPLIHKRIPAGYGIPSYVFTHKRPYVTNDLPNDPLFYSREYIGKIQGLACVPLLTQNAEIEGWLSTGVRRMWSPEEIRILTAISDIAANALHRHALHEQLEQRVNRLASLHAIDTAITTNFDLGITIDMVLKHVVEQLDIDATDVLALDTTSNTLKYLGGRGFRSDAICNTALGIGQGHAGIVALERKILQAPNLIAQPDLIVRREMVELEQFTSYFGAPLLVKGQVKGVLEVFTRNHFEPTHDWLEFFNTLATQTAIALDNMTLFTNLVRSNNELSLAYDSTLEGWSRALDLRDKETEGHSWRVMELSTRLARAMQLDEDQITAIRRGALLHDIGKMAVPDRILHKAGPLTQAEWRVMHLHPEYARQMLAPISYLNRSLEIPYYHHERWNGTGYPLGLAGEQIPIAARIFTIADVWDALCSDRPYRLAWPRQKALAYIRSKSSVYFDPQVVKAFIQVIESIDN
jgi:PAS domain S-box-containing protein